MRTFIANLYETGEILVEDTPLPSEELLRADLEAVDEAVRLELPGEAPDLDLPSALWAAGIFYYASSFVCLRHIDEATVMKRMSVACPGEVNAESVYSVDLCFRFLPGLVALAGHLSKKDPLTLRLRALAWAWPLSSVGIRDLEDGVGSIHAFIDHPCLRQLYADRIFVARDKSRLDRPEVKNTMRKNLGGYLERYPEWKELLGETSEP